MAGKYANILFFEHVI